MWNGTMFVDLDWPLNASSLLSASAELLVESVLMLFAKNYQTRSLPNLSRFLVNGYIPEATSQWLLLLVQCSEFRRNLLWRSPMRWRSLWLKGYPSCSDQSGRNLSVQAPRFDLPIRTHQWSQQLNPVCTSAKDGIFYPALVCRSASNFT